jgi:hypothetical protein
MRTSKLSVLLLQNRWATMLLALSSPLFAPRLFLLLQSSFQLSEARKDYGVASAQNHRTVGMAINNGAIKRENS